MEAPRVPRRVRRAVVDVARAGPYAPGVRAQPILVVLAVEDVPRATAFYRAAFSWTVVVDVGVYVELETPGPFRVGLYARGGFAKNTGRLPVHVPPGEVAPGEVYLRVADVPAAVASVLAAGGRLLSPASVRPWGDEVAYFADPDGHVLALSREAEEA
jgi:predicted enzyme related to lactoylglutathione lyase